ncbi:hypothetical protein KFL_009740020 [Klebsormidium nitens]|uniref:Uncharacterized protein n=1 Tax=Klebsormidium nitens TaxID=105231 RepID=A0A1Y1IVL7_KLENI|nr:hypothetical protein KFL_009740020 [Klebsormidium nitens]|eukprot:GAQ92308.1 hypothetical protein KFL_009740020 [Klebsormidium nitens]
MGLSGRFEMTAPRRLQVESLSELRTETLPRRKAVNRGPEVPARPVSDEQLVFSGTQLRGMRAQNAEATGPSSSAENGSSERAPGQWSEAEKLAWVQARQGLPESDSQPAGDEGGEEEEPVRFAAKEYLIDVLSNIYSCHHRMEILGSEALGQAITAFYTLSDDAFVLLDQQFRRFNTASTLCEKMGLSNSLSLLGKGVGKLMMFSALIHGLAEFGDGARSWTRSWRRPHPSKVNEPGANHAWPWLLPPLAKSAVKMLKKFAAAEKLPITTINKATPFASGEELQARKDLGADLGRDLSPIEYTRRVVEYVVNIEEGVFGRVIEDHEVVPNYPGAPPSKQMRERGPVFCKKVPESAEDREKLIGALERCFGNNLGIEEFWPGGVRRPPPSGPGAHRNDDVAGNVEEMSEAQDRGPSNENQEPGAGPAADTGNGRSPQTANGHQDPGLRKSQRSTKRNQQSVQEEGTEPPAKRSKGGK